jgi:hypothetical protein
MLIPNKIPVNSIYNLFWNKFALKSNAKLGWSVSGARTRYTHNQAQTENIINIKNQRPAKSTFYHFDRSVGLWQYFLQSWKIQRPNTNVNYKVHREFRLMFLSNSSSRSSNSLVSASRYFSRWVDSYNLLLNLHYADAQAQALSNKLFLEESLIFNWNQSLQDYKLFRYTQQYFIFKDLPHGAYTHSALLTILLQRLDYVLIIDLKNHRKLIGYLQKYSLYSVGLVPSGQNPWTVSYPVPSFSDSTLSQYYFLRWALNIRSRARFLTFKNRF